LGQHLVAVPPPTAARGFDGIQPEHPTRKLFAFLSELADQADRDNDGRLNDALIDACGMIRRVLPGQQDCETLEVVPYALARAGEHAAKRYGDAENWHGTFDAARDLRAFFDLLSSHCPGRNSQDETTHGWLVESIATIGSWALGNKEKTILDSWHGRSMGVQVAQQLSEVPLDKLAHALHELMLRQHYEHIPRERRDEFVGICQRMRNDLLGLRRLLDVPDLVDVP
jgi:hypothetical protein